MTRRAFTRLYVHVPFCSSKCDYCAFYSEAPFRRERCECYLEALQSELDRVARDCGALESIFIGGGTPTLLGPQRLSCLLGSIRERFTLSAPVEWTCESTPSTLSGDVIAALVAGGVTRISIGVQTFSKELRRKLGRRDPGRTIAGMIDCCRSQGLQRINLDLIFGIPGQTLNDWESDLKTALDLGVEHLSAYCLTFEEGTRLHSRLDPPPDDSLAADMWDTTDQITAAYGLQRYEISNFSSPGNECRHNVGIWLGDTYAGCGPAASSFDGLTRWQSPSSLDDWLAGHRPELDELPAAARAAEILAVGLRLARGWQVSRFEETTGFDPYKLCGEALKQLAEQNLLDLSDTVIKPTQEGMRFNDTVAEALLLD